MRSGVINSSEPRTRQASGSELSGVTVSAVKWVTNKSTGFDELVRTSDGQVLDRRLSTKKGDSRMKRSPEERARAHFGTKPGDGHLTIRGFAGQHETSGAIMVSAQCDCGKHVPRAMLSDITLGRRKYCDRECTVAEQDRQDRKDTRAATKSSVNNVDTTRQEDSAQKVARRSGVKKQRKTGGKSKAIAPRATENPSNNGLGPVSAPPRDFAGISSTVEAIATLAEKVSLEDAEALVEELRRMESEPPPIFGQNNRIRQVLLPSYRRLAEAFVGFRQGIGE